MTNEQDKDKVMPVIPAPKGDGRTSGYNTWVEEQRDADWLIYVRDIEALRQQLAEVRRRVITDYSDGTGPDAGHWGVCRICEWVWRFDGPENHEPTCPVKKTP